MALYEAETAYEEAEISELTGLWREMDRVRVENEARGVGESEYEAIRAYSESCSVIRGVVVPYARAVMDTHTWFGAEKADAMVAEAKRRVAMERRSWHPQFDRSGRSFTDGFKRLLGEEE